jgi:hypothetical protein
MERTVKSEKEREKMNFEQRKAYRCAGREQDVFFLRSSEVVLGTELAERRSNI